MSARAIAYEQYLINAQAIGVSREDARAELVAIQREGIDGDIFEIAWQRLIGGERRG